MRKIFTKKYYFLLYPLIFGFAPVHETVHIFIAWLFGIRIVRLDYAMTYFEKEGSNLHWYLQGLWDYPIDKIILPIVTTISILFFIYFHLKNHGINLRYIRLIRFNPHPKKVVSQA